MTLSWWGVAEGEFLVGKGEARHVSNCLECGGGAEGVAAVGGIPKLVHGYHFSTVRGEGGW